jgi:predicted lipoprotein with Yx(FWY)xxD motif
VKRTHFGDVLAVGHGRLTVYEFGADRGSNSACSGACAAAWPPVTGHAVAGPGVRSSLLGTIRRPDGRVQVTYRGHPLYRFIKDRDDGDTYGQGSRAFGASWYALRSSGAVADTT